jgi:hypothetical protein
MELTAVPPPPAVPGRDAAKSCSCRALPSVPLSSLSLPPYLYIMCTFQDAVSEFNGPAVPRQCRSGPLRHRFWH